MYLKVLFLYLIVLWVLCLWVNMYTYELRHMPRPKALSTPGARVTWIWVLATQSRTPVNNLLRVSCRCQTGGQTLLCKKIRMAWGRMTLQPGSDFFKTQYRLGKSSPGHHQSNQSNSRVTIKLKV